MADVVRILRDESVDLSKPLPFKDPVQLYTKISGDEWKLLQKFFPEDGLYWHRPSSCGSGLEDMSCEACYARPAVPEKAFSEVKLVTQEFGFFDHLFIWSNRHKTASVIIGRIGMSKECRWYPIVAFGNEEYLNRINEKAREKKLGWEAEIVLWSTTIFGVLWTLAPIIGVIACYYLAKENAELKNEIAYHEKTNEKIENLQWAPDWSQISPEINNQEISPDSKFINGNAVVSFRQKFSNLKNVKLLIRKDWVHNGIKCDYAMFIRCEMNNGDIYEALPWIDYSACMIFIKETDWQKVEEY